MDKEMEKFQQDLLQSVRQMTAGKRARTAARTAVVRTAVTLYLEEKADTADVAKRKTKA